MQKKLSQIKTRTDYVDEVYRVLLDAISDGSLAPGTRLTQEEIAEQLKVSRSPVLQALRLLKKDGFVEDAPGRGLQVTALDVEWIGHLYDIRGAIDALAARLAAGARASIDMNLIEAGRRASAGTNVKKMIDADLAFHMAIYEACGNPMVVETARLHWVHLRRIMGAVLQSSSQRRAIWDEHEAIAQAINQGKVGSASELSDLHTAHARKNLIHRLEEIMARPESHAV